jgi:hypothetical protein
MISPRLVLVLCCLAVPFSALGQTTQRSVPMAKYVIERDLPGAGKLSPAELRAISQKSRSVLNEMGPKIQWVESYVTDDKIYCVYMAEHEGDLRRHAEVGGFPINRVSRIRGMIDPTSAD